MRITYITQMDDSYASFRYRMKIPGDELSSMGHDVKYKSFINTATDSVVFSKHFHYGEIDLALTSKHLNQKVVYDICDNHLIDSPHNGYYRAMIKVANIITASTPELANIIKDETGVSSTVIADPFEYPEKAPKTIEKKEQYKLLWFGNTVNLDSLINNWDKINKHLVLIITGDKAKSMIKFPVMLWSKENMLRGFDEADAVIIPSLTNARKVVKSANRMIESIRQGVFVIANPIPSYEQFSNWMYIGDIREGIDWMREHTDEIPDRIRDAQKYVNENFSPEIIARQWEAVLN